MKTLLFSLILVVSTGTFAHKFYVSIADLNYNSTKNRIEGSIKFTAHDFEAVLENKFQRKIEMETVSDTSGVGRYCQVYLSQHFKLSSDGKELIPNYIGKEITPTQDLYFYFSFADISNPKSIKITNTLLFELFPEQQNIVHYRYQQQTKSVTLVASKKQDTIFFE